MALFTVIGLLLNLKCPIDVQDLGNEKTPHHSYKNLHEDTQDTVSPSIFARMRYNL